MPTTRVWDLIDRARAAATEPDDAYDVAEQAVALLARQRPDEILEVDHGLAELMATSYTAELWAAAYLVNGGASDDGFDYFRGWLLTQGREVFERVVAQPDALADVTAVREVLEEGDDLECEDALGIAWDAYREATGEDLPEREGITLPDIDLAPYDFDDDDQMAELLPRLAALVDEVDGLEEDDEDEDDDA